jgi:hypothetical protein
MIKPENVSSPDASINDHNIARLYTGIKIIDNNLAALKKAPMWDKSAAAETVIQDTRTLLFHMANAIHGLKNDIARLQAKNE